MCRPFLIGFQPKTALFRCSGFSLQNSLWKVKHFIFALKIYVWVEKGCIKLANMNNVDIRQWCL